ncbi:hypothetical protein KP79_PYT05356 [Mizuhopecten yessoensis]|uniref:SGNH hydrolase-type esterase domain-containing protein n=1 Tax=Mizuhopecten yessoensis TaxID=6573 RepID=A0A210QEL8_MIZYE|nr:hypothetical protein KP79_PYT05356 [Mizuhopecten yessoensis]
MDQTKVLVLGHSFVRRLEADLTGSWTNLGFDSDLVRVHCVGRGGGRVHDILSTMSQSIVEIKPKVVLLQIGGNDLDSVNFTEVQGRLARDLRSIAQWLREGYSVRQVEVMQLFYRAKTRSIAVETYNRSVDAVNSEIKRLYEESEDFFYWRHKGLKTAAFDCLNKDGVHLSRAGLRKYKYSVRGAVLQGIRLADRDKSEPRDICL